MKNFLARFSVLSGSLLLLPLSNLITTPIFSRLLGPQGKGELVLILQPLTIMDSIAGAGIASYIVSQSRLKNSAATRESQFLLPLVASNLIGICVLTIWYKVYISTWADGGFLVIISYLCLPLGTWIAIHKARLAISGELRPVVLEAFLNAILRTLIAFIFFFFEIQNPAILGFAFICSGLLSGFICLRPPSVSREFVGLDGLRLRHFKPPAPVLWIFDITTIASSRIDQLMLSIVYSKSNLGLYSVALLVAELPLILSQSVSRELINSNKKTTKPDPKFFITAEMLFLTSCISAYLAAFLIPNVFGKEFYQAIELCQLIILGTFFQMNVHMFSTIMLLNGVTWLRYPLYLIPLVTMTIGVGIASKLTFDISFFIKFLIMGWILSFLYGLINVLHLSKRNLGHNATF